MIRRATPEDVPILAALHAACFTRAWSAAELLTFLRDPAVVGFVAPQGFVLVRRAADEAEILTLCVGNSARESGVGTALVRQAAAALHSSGAASLFLEVSATNAAARGLYAKLGFEVAGSRKAYYGPGDDALILKTGLPLGNATSSINIVSLKQGM